MDRDARQVGEAPLGNSSPTVACLSRGHPSLWLRPARRACVRLLMLAALPRAVADAPLSILILVPLIPFGMLLLRAWRIDVYDARDHLIVVRPVSTVRLRWTDVESCDLAGSVTGMRMVSTPFIVLRSGDRIRLWEWNDASALLLGSSAAVLAEGINYAISEHDRKSRWPPGQQRPDGVT